MMVTNLSPWAFACWRKYTCPGCTISNVQKVRTVFISYYLNFKHFGVCGVSQYIIVQASALPSFTLQLLHPSYQETQFSGMTGVSTSSFSSTGTNSVHFASAGVSQNIFVQANGFPSSTLQLLHPSNRLVQPSGMTTAVVSSVVSVLLHPVRMTTVIKSPIVRSFFMRGKLGFKSYY